MKFLQLAGCFALSILALVAVLAFTAVDCEAENIAKVGPAKKSHEHAEGWSGIITYQKTLYENRSSDEPLLGSVDTARNRVRHQTERVYRYISQIVVIDGTSKNPKTDANITFLDSDISNGRQIEWATCGWGPEHYFVVAGEDTKLTKGRVTAPAEDFNLGIDEQGGTYHFSVKLPEGKGFYTHEEHVKRTGFCQPANNEPTDLSDAYETKIEPQVASIDDGKLDPKNPNRLKGSKSWDTSSPTIKSFAYAITWDLRRGPDNVMITDFHFEHPVYPDWNDWQPITLENGTIDGNPVKIKVTVANLSSERKDAVVKLTETFKGDHWNAAMKDEPLENGVFNVTLDPGEERTVELQFDSTGYAWMDDAPHQPLEDTPRVRPFSVHRIRADLLVNDVKKDEKTENIKIAPRPVVFLHGLWSNNEEWSSYQNYLTEAWGYDWRAYPVGEYPQHGELRMGIPMTDDAGVSITENVAALTSYVEYARKNSKAWHVDIVAHSTGGLVARRYIHSVMGDAPDHRPSVTHLVMLGTPNAGSACAAVMNLGHSVFGAKVKALEEVTPDEVAKFNQRVTDRRGVLFSALAGFYFPISCGHQEWNDGLVTVSSAIAGVEDFKIIQGLSVDLVGGRAFNFIKGRLAIGKQGEHPRNPPSREVDWIPAAPEVRWVPKHKAEWRFDRGEEDVAENIDAVRPIFAAAKDTVDAPATSVSAPAAASAPANDFSRVVPLYKFQVATLDVPVAAGNNFSITFFADPEVSVSLLDEKGAVLGASLAGKLEAKQTFRSVYVKKEIPQKTTWKIKIENTGRRQSSVMLRVSTEAEAKPATTESARAAL